MHYRPQHHGSIPRRTPQILSGVDRSVSWKNWPQGHKTGNTICETFKIERKLLLTASYMKSYMGSQLPPMYFFCFCFCGVTLQDQDWCRRSGECRPWMTSERDSISRSFIDSLNATKKWRNTAWMTAMPCRVAGCIISIRPTYSWVRAFIYLLIYLHRITSVIGNWLQFPDFSANDLSYFPLPLTGPKIINVLHG